MSNFYSKFLQSALVLFISMLPAITLAQETTFFESFDNTEVGDLPAQWTWYQKGGNNPLAYWKVHVYNFFGPKVAYSGVEGALAGYVDEDWLITPQITPKDGDFLGFESAQTYNYFDYGTKYHVLISTATNNPVDFSDTLKTFTELDLPKYFGRTFLDLKDYANIPIYIAFVHETSSTDGNQTDDWYLDNVRVGPVMPASFSRAEVSWQFANPIRISEAATSPMLGFKIRIDGDTGNSDLSSFTLTTEGVSEELKIEEVTLYTTYNTPSISFTPGDSVYADVFGQMTAPDDTFTITGNQQLEIGDNYFWLTYKFKNTIEPEYPYPKADAGFEAIVVDGTTHGSIKDTVVISPFIVPDIIPNDSIADAIELSAIQSHYGSYNTRATQETATEKLVYCAPGGFRDTANSVWWYFVAPTDGYISADLSGTDFNTLLAFLSEDMNQLACNDDIDPGLELQSRITNFQISQGQRIYIRVTGMGLPGDPNGAQGIVRMDFSFEGLVNGIDDWKGQVLSPIYPNPASNMASVDIRLTTPREVTLTILDLLGQKVKTISYGRLPTVEKQALTFDISALEAGAYLVEVSGEEKVVSRLIITR